MQQARQFGQQLGVNGGLVTQCIQKPLRPHLVEHPLFQERFGRAPQVQIRVQLAAQAFDVEQGFLQQHQLRLDLDLEPPRCLEQPHQHHTQRNFTQGAVEIGFTHGADGRLQLVHPGIRRHPARFDVQLGDPFVVTPEEGREILRKVLFVELGECAHNAKVERDVAPKRLGCQADLDIAGVHVGVEEAVAKNLRKKQRDTVARQLGDINPCITQPLDLVDRHTGHTLHHDHLGVAEVPEHLGNQHQVQPLHVAAQLRGIGGLLDQVEFVVQVVVEFGHHLARLQAFAVGAEFFHPARHGAHELQVFLDGRAHAGAQDLDGHIPQLARAVADGGEMYLRNRSAGDRLPIKMHKHFIHLAAERTFDGGYGDGRVKGRYAVLQQHQLIGDVLRHQVSPGGQHLAQLHEDGA